MFYQSERTLWYKSLHQQVHRLHIPSVLYFCIQLETSLLHPLGWKNYIVLQILLISPFIVWPVISYYIKATLDTDPNINKGVSPLKNSKQRIGLCYHSQLTYLLIHGLTQLNWPKCSIIISLESLTLYVNLQFRPKLLVEPLDGFQTTRFH